MGLNTQSRRWRPPRRFDRNLIVIGAGSAGLVSAYIAATLRAQVTLVEERAMGGDCLNSGCIPSKTLIHAARLAEQMRAAAHIGIGNGRCDIHYPSLMQYVQEVIGRVSPRDSVERYRALGVDVRFGHARILNPWTVDVDGEVLTTRAIMIAAGAEPLVPALPGLKSNYVTSNTLWSLKNQPRKMVVLGGGPIGCEMAQTFTRLGTEVTLVEMAERLLLREDHEVSEFVAEQLSQDGVDVRLSHRALCVENSVDGKVLICSGDGHEVRLGFDTLLVAVGRKPRTRGYGLEELGILAPHAVETNGYLQALHPNIYVCGDAAGPYQYTHAAAHQAWQATVNALLRPWYRHRIDYSLIPAVTYVDPEVGRIGLNEREALIRDIEYETTRYEFSELDRALTENAGRGFIKVLTVPGKQRILGVTIVGDRAAELLAEFALAMHCNIGLGRFMEVIHPYPSWAEANKAVAGVWKRAHAPERLLNILERYHSWRRTRISYPTPFRRRTPD